MKSNQDSVVFKQFLLYLVLPSVVIAIICVVSGTVFGDTGIISRISGQTNTESDMSTGTSLDPQDVFEQFTQEAAPPTQIPTPTPTPTPNPVPGMNMDQQILPYLVGLGCVGLFLLIIIGGGTFILFQPKKPPVE